MQVHGDNVVGASTGEEVCNESSCLCDPLLVSWLWLEVLRGVHDRWVLVIVSGKVWGGDAGSWAVFGRSVRAALGRVGAAWWGDAIRNIILQGRLAQLLLQALDAVGKSLALWDRAVWGSWARLE